MSPIELIKAIICKLSPYYSYIDAYKVKFNKHKQYNNNEKRINNVIYNRDLLPIGAHFVKYYNNKKYVCIIANNGKYVVNNKEYDSLSEAAKSVTHVRTEGMRFWKIDTDENKNNNKSVLNLFRGENDN